MGFVEPIVWLVEPVGCVTQPTVSFLESIGLRNGTTVWTIETTDWTIQTIVSTHQPIG